MREDVKKKSRLEFRIESWCFIIGGSLYEHETNKYPGNGIYNMYKPRWQRVRKRIE